MANMYNINGLSYTANTNPEWFTRAMFGGRLVAGGYVRVLTGIKGDELLNQIDLENKVLQIDGKDCAWTPNQVIKLSEKTASVKTYKINLEQCIDELEQKRTLYMLSPGAQNNELPDELEEATLALISFALSNEIEEMIVGGDATVNPNHFNGMVKTLLTSTQAIKLPGQVITKANVLGLVEEVYDAIPENVLQGEDAGTLFIMASYATRRKIRNALASVNNQVIAANWTVDDADKRNPRLFYLGVEIVAAKGISDNTLIGYDAANAFLLTDLLSDLEDVTLGQFPAPNDNKVFIKGRLRLGFVMPFEDEAVIMDPSITEASGGYTEDDGLRVVPNSLVFEAAGESKTFTVITDAGVTPTVDGDNSGFTVTKGTTTAGVTTVTVVSTGNEGSRDPRVGQVVVSVPDTNRRATVTLDQRTEDVPTITP